MFWERYIYFDEKFCVACEKVQKMESSRVIRNILKKEALTVDKNDCFCSVS